MSTQFRFDGTVSNPIGEALSGLLVYVCTQPANTSTIPPSPLATLWADALGTVPLANPVVVDGLGNFFFYTATGTYTLVYFDPEGRVENQIFPDQQVVSQGGGSVTSVGLTVPAEFSVTGSPVTGSGTLAISKVNQNANLIYAGPVSGGPGSPGFRPMVAADLPAGGGSVTSVAHTLTGGPLFSASVTGSPITGAGTLADTFDLQPQAANTFIAGPTAGGTGAMTARKITPADLPPAVTTAFSASPTFDSSTAGSFKMTLTGDVTSSTVSNAATGMSILFEIIQDSAGSHLFTWPANFKGASQIGMDANNVSLQRFYYDGANWRAESPGSVNAT